MRKRRKKTIMDGSDTDLAKKLISKKIKPAPAPCHAFKILGNKPLSLHYAVLPKKSKVMANIRRFLENVR